jgi:carboxymethylenebutenolidase
VGPQPRLQRLFTQPTSPTHDAAKPNTGVTVCGSAPDAGFRESSAVTRLGLGGDGVSEGFEHHIIDGTDVRYWRPAGQDPIAGVLMLHEISGVSYGILDAARRLVGHGYAVAVPNLYSGGPRRLCVTRTLLDALVGSGGRTQTRIGAVRDWLVGELGGPGRARVALLGFCMGGGFALAAAGKDRYQVASVNYGSVPWSRSRLDDVCPVVASYGERDLVFRRSGRRLHRFLEELKIERGLDSDYKPYPDSGHGFITLPDPDGRHIPIPLLRVGYNQLDSGDAWKRILAFFVKHLHPPEAPGA